MNRTKKIKSKIGDVFCLKTRCGNCFFQYVQRHSVYGQLISVISSNIDRPMLEWNRVFDIFFPVSAAANDPEVELIGNYEIPDSYFSPVPLKYPILSLARNEVVGWMIEDEKGSRRTKELSENQKYYAYAFSVNLSELEKLFCDRWSPILPYPI